MASELLSLRQAVERIAAAGVAGHSRAREVLWAGLAGAPERVRGRVLYDSEGVEQLLCRRPVDPERLDRSILPAIVLRMTARHPPEEGDGRAWIGVDVTAATAEQEEAFRRWWVPPPGGRAGLRDRLAAGGRIPLIVTVGGYVAANRDVVGLEDSGSRIGFVVRPAGAWAAEVDGRTLPLGGGPVVVMWRPG